VLGVVSKIKREGGITMQKVFDKKTDALLFNKRCLISTLG
jgi:hypothetical protein